MSTILPPNPDKPIRSAFWYSANGSFYALAISLVLIGLALYIREPGIYREATVAAIPCVALFINFWWFAKKGMDQRG